MSRQIKFRVWDGKELHDEHSQDTTIDFKGRWSVSIGGQYICDFRNGILSQFTGLKDKNSKDIYEGDIVKLTSWSPSVYQVGFDRGGFCFYEDESDGYYNDIKYLEKCEVIGNIFENKELLTNK